MAYPLILPLDEQKERHLFAGFLWRTFSFGRSSSSQFEGSLSAEALLDIYRTYHPGTILTTDIIAHVITFGGYMNEYGEVYLKINPEVFGDLPAVTQERILSYCNYAKSLKLRQIMLGNDAAVVDRNLALNESFRHFVQTQLFDKKFKYWNAIPKGQRNTSMKDLYEYYQTWCLKGNYVPQSKKELSNVLSNLGYKIKQGYYKGTSGVRVITECIIPQTEEERNATLENGNLGIIILQGRRIFNDGIVLDSLSEDGLSAYIKGRRCVSSAEQRAAKEREKEKEEKQQTSSDRSRAEIPPISLSQRAQEVLKTEERRTYRGNNEEDESITQGDSRTSGRATEGRISKDTFAATRYPNERDDVTGYRDTSLDEIREAGYDEDDVAGFYDGDQEEYDRDSYGEIQASDGGFTSTLGQRFGGCSTIVPDANGGLGSNTSGGDQTLTDVEIPLTGASKKAFYTGLRVTYRLLPSGSFNFEVFEEEVSRANLGLLTNEQKRALYNDFLKTIKK